MSPSELFHTDHLKSAVIPGSVPLETTNPDFETFEVLGVDHLDLTVTDLSRSLPFYTKILGALGFRKLVHPHYNGFHNAHLIIGIKEAAAEEKAAGHNRFRAGLHHLALKANRKADVDRLGGQVIDMMAKMREQMEKMPPQQREMVEKREFRLCSG